MGVAAYLLLFVATVVPSFLVSILAVALVRRWAVRLGLLDQPGERKVHLRAVPLGGGLGIWAGVVSTFAAGTFVVWLGVSSESISGLVPDGIRIHLPGMLASCGQLWILLAGGTVLMLLGLADDSRGLPWQWRIGVETLVAAVCVYSQGLQLTAYIELPWITSIFSVLWIVALINSFNMLDNMDGLSGGVASIVGLILAVMMLTSPDPSTQQPQLFVAAMLLVLVGGLFGFLFHNWPPAKIFMGDAGSYFVGFWIAVATLLATYAGYRGTQPHAVLAPLCVLAVPLYDMLSVIWIRLREGRSPFEGDKRHFSHRLVELGLTKTQAVLTIYLATLTCGLGGLLMRRVDFWGAPLVIAVICCTLALVAILESNAWRKRT